MADVVCLVANFHHKKIEKGCFEEGAHVRYRKMLMETKYWFRDVRVILKDHRDPYVYIYHDPKILRELKQNSSSSFGIVVTVLLLLFSVR